MATASGLNAHLGPKEAGQLDNNDLYWCKLQPWLQEQGYMLRPRFRPGWIPSWISIPGTIAAGAEDGWGPSAPQAMDAVRMEDGAAVILKRVEKEIHPHETDIHSFLTSESLINDPKNHCIPLLDVLEPPSIPGTQLLVMKLLRQYHDPHFDTIGEAVDFVRQIFEGIQFMHKHSVAHRDCGSLNIMMDGQNLYPNGFHPRLQFRNPNFVGKAKHFTRTQAPPKYYLIDFGISLRFPPDVTRPMALPIEGGDRSVPEFEGDGVFEPTDAFATDIYYLGNLIRNEFLDGQSKRLDYYGLEGFDFLRPLVNDMVKRNPKERPTIDEVVDRLEQIVGGLSAWKIRSRVRGKEEYTIISCPRIVRHWYRRIGFMIKRVPAIPSYKFDTTSIM
ncbi:hypothetical protein B0H11DRAFT_1803966 [Mycena galericulata]|nr:hypothetical protein B0H11DRAFT_1803966 [Mycena galericulata]